MSASSVTSNGAPVQWAGNASYWPTLIGAISGVAAAWAAYAMIYLNGPPPHGTSFLSFYLARALIGGSLGLLAIYLAMTLIPLPAPRIGVYPGGVVFDYGLRQETVAKTRLRLVGSRLFVLPRWLGPAASYRLNVHQVNRIRLVVNGIDT